MMKFRNWIAAKSIRSMQIILLILPLLIVIGVWEIGTRLGNVPIYILPAPSIVVHRLLTDIGFFATNGAITLFQALCGFCLGSAVSLIAAIIMVQSRSLERALFPIAVLVKVTPVVAVAPLFVIWFGFGFIPIVLVAALITFFSVLVNAIIGLKSVNPGALEFLQSLNASKKEIFLFLRVPSSLPYVFASFRIAIPLSLIGAFVGEFFGGARGLGGVIFVAYHNLDMPTSFAAIIVMAALGICLTILTMYLEKRVLFWHDSAVR